MEESTNTTSVSQVSIKWGVILGLVLVVFGLIITLTDNFGNQGLSLINYIFLIAAIVLAHKEFKSSGDGFMSYGQGLGIGTLVSFIGVLISGIFTYIYLEFVDPAILDSMRDVQLLELEKQGMSDAQIDQALSFMTPGLITVFAVLIFVFIGFILSLIIAAITKNSNPDLQV